VVAVANPLDAHGREILAVSVWASNGGHVRPLERMAVARAPLKIAT
jgi:hypothetical protein